MCDIKYKEQILEAIDQLRRRKARPDASRIYNALSRRYAVSFVDAKVALEQCVENGIVLRVEYKGSISYRNAAKKFSHLKRENQAEIIRENRTKFTGLLTKAIADLVLQEPDYLQEGVPGNELIKTILSKDNVRYTRKYVTILLEKEVHSGSLIKMENDNYLVGPAKTNTFSKIEKPFFVKCAEVVREVDESNEAQKRSGSKHSRFKKDELNDKYTFIDKRDDNAKLRVGRRRKRAKKVFDPSDNNLPKKRGRPIGSFTKSNSERSLSKLSDNESRPESQASNPSHRDHGGVCSVCHNQNRKGPNERMVSCRECSNKAHHSCLNGEDLMLRLCPDNTWQCPHCKTCVICDETSDSGYLAVCFVCADAYHMTCHQPNIKEKIKSGCKWLCGNCQMSDQLAIKDIQIGIEHIPPSLKAESPSSPSNMSGMSSPEEVSPPASPSPPCLSPRQNGHRASPTFSANGDSPISETMDWEDQIDPSVPDATHWSCDDVYNYFVQYFPEEAKVFKEQAIDGRSLLLMKRTDVTKHMNLKLGPAVKIYRHVVRLQMRRDDPKYFWL